MAEKYRARTIIPPAWQENPDREKFVQIEKMRMLDKMLFDIVAKYGDRFSISVSFTYREHDRRDMLERDTVEMEAIVSDA